MNGGFPKQAPWIAYLYLCICILYIFKQIYVPPRYQTPWMRHRWKNLHRHLILLFPFLKKNIFCKVSKYFVEITQIRLTSFRTKCFGTLYKYFLQIKQINFTFQTNVALDLAAVQTKAHCATLCLFRRGEYTVLRLQSRFLTDLQFNFKLGSVENE